jgi:hypothetical protein
MVFRRTSGRSVAGSALAILACLSLTACYRLTGGGGFPGHIRTIYIETFENTTDRFDLDQPLFRELTDELPRAFGVRLGTQESSDAVVRGRIVSYQDQAQTFAAGGQGNLNQVQVSVAVEIVDRTRNVVLWEQGGLSGRGEYRPDSQSDEVARVVAIESIVRQIIDGAQSQW